MATLTKEYIQNLLMTNDHAVGRALIVLNERQTSSEQNCQTTISNNGVGFRPCDARMGTSMAQFYAKYNRLSERQLAYWRKPQAKGVRIAMYWRQLIEIAEAKKAAQG